MPDAQPSHSFECPRCQTMITLSAGQNATSVTCRNCRAVVQVPMLGERAPSDFDDLFEIESPSDSSVDSSSSKSVPSESPSSDLIAPAGGDPDQPGEDLLWLDPELPPAESLGQGADPFEKDELAPIRFDDDVVAANDPNQIRVRCPVCESVMFTSKAMAGRKIQCSDCFTMVEVKTDQPRKPTVEPLDRSKTRSTPDEWSDLHEISDDSTSSEQPSADEYGLEPASEDLLAPRDVPLPPELQELVRSLGPVPESTPPAGKPSTPAESTSAQPSAKPKPPTPETSKPVSPKPDSPKSKITGEALLPDVEAPLPPLKKLTYGEQFKFPEQFLCIFRDGYVVSTAGLVALVLTMGYIVQDFGFMLYEWTENGARLYAVFGFFVGVISLGILFFAMLSAGLMINQLVEGAAYRRSVFHPPEYGLSEIITNLAPVAISFWAAMLPGVVLGVILYNSIGHFEWLLYAGAFGTAFWLFPIGILSAYYNGSPLQIVSGEVLRTIGTHTAGWLRFYAWMAVWIALFCGAWFFRLIPWTLVGSPLCALIQGVSLALMGRTIGLLAQSFINFWIDDLDASSES